MLFVVCWFFSKPTFSKNTIRMSNSLDPDQARRFVEPDLGPNCLKKLSADTSWQRDLIQKHGKWCVCETQTPSPYTCNYIKSRLKVKIIYSCIFEKLFPQGNIKALCPVVPKFVAHTSKQRPKTIHPLDLQYLEAKNIYSSSSPPPPPSPRDKD